MTDTASPTAGKEKARQETAEERALRKERRRGRWILTLNISYYLLPFVYSGFILAIVTLGHDWFLNVTWAMNYINPWSEKFTGGTLPLAVQYRLHMIVAVFVMVRTYVALAIPPERTLQQNVDMALALVPVLTILYLLSKWWFQNYQVGTLEWYFMMYALGTSVTFDFFGARLAQKLISAYRRRLDIAP